MLALGHAETHESFVYARKTQFPTDSMIIMVLVLFVVFNKACFLTLELTIGRPLVLVSSYGVSGASW